MGKIREDVYRSVVQKRKQYITRNVSASIIGNCQRLLWYQLQGHNLAFNVDPGGSVLLKEAKDVHENHMVELLEEAGYKIHSREGDIKTINSRWDGLIQIDNQDWLLELKAFGPHNFEKLMNLGLREGFPHYYAQVQDMLREVDSWIPGAVFFVKQVYPPDYYDERVYSDPEFQEELQNKRELIKNRVKQGVSPDRPFKFTSEECKSCPAQHLCWGDTINLEYVLTPSDMSEEDNLAIVTAVARYTTAKSREAETANLLRTVDDVCSDMLKRYNAKSLRAYGLSYSLYERTTTTYDMQALTKLVRSGILDMARKTTKKIVSRKTLRLV